MKKRRIKMEVGSGNIFADLGLPDAEELLLKSQIVVTLRRLIKARSLTQTEAAKRIGIGQPAPFKPEKVTSFEAGWKGDFGRHLKLSVDGFYNNYNGFQVIVGYPLIPTFGFELNVPNTTRIYGGEAEASIAEQAHYLGHQDALKASLSVGENLTFWIEYLGGSRTAVPAALEAVGLAPLAGLPAAYLSAGQRRRLSIARLAAVERPLWLLDEPTSALDAPSQERLAGLMRAHLGTGGMIVAATHGPIGLDARELRLGAP